MTIRATVTAVDDADNDVCEANTCMAEVRFFRVGEPIVMEWIDDSHEMRQYHEECYGIPDVQLDELVTQLRARVSELAAENDSMLRRIEMDQVELHARERLLRAKREQVFGVGDMTPQEYTVAVNAGKSYVLNLRSEATPTEDGLPRLSDVVDRGGIPVNRD